MAAYQRLSVDGEQRQQSGLAPGSSLRPGSASCSAAVLLLHFDCRALGCMSQCSPLPGLSCWQCASATSLKCTTNTPLLTRGHCQLVAACAANTRHAPHTEGICSHPAGGPQPDMHALLHSLSMSQHLPSLCGEQEEDLPPLPCGSSAAAWSALFQQQMHATRRPSAPQVGPHLLSKFPSGCTNHLQCMSHPIPM